MLCHDYVGSWVFFLAHMTCQVTERHREGGPSTHMKIQGLPATPAERAQCSQKTRGQHGNHELGWSSGIDS